MTGTGDPIHQADDAGVSPAPQAGETPEASVYKPPPKRDDSDPHNFGKMAQGGIPPQTAPPQTEVVGKDQSLMHMMQYQTINPNWMRRDDNAASEVELAPSTPPARSNQEKSGQKPPMRHNSLPGVLVEEPDQESSDEEEDGWSRLT
ncbi:hypothetical protein C0995_016275, partial [Termitomyces sp. Mi166